jgi:hypothetical protein
VRELRLGAAAAAAPVVAAGFYALAVLRRRRSLHPAGVGFQGQLLISNDAPDRPGVALLRPGATYRALLRFSRGAGLPEPLPDALGVAIKLPDAHGPGADQDLLLTRSTSRPLLRRLLFPARSFVRGAFSTALPYDLDGQRVVVLLAPAPTGNGRSPRGCRPRRRVGGAACRRRCRAWLRASDRGHLWALAAAGHPDRRRGAPRRADRGAALQPLDHGTGDPPVGLAELVTRRRLPGEPARPPRLSIAPAGSNPARRLGWPRGVWPWGPGCRPTGRRPGRRRRCA